MGKTVLIVEDEKAIVEILKFNLQREGYSVLEALDGEAGLELAQAEDPDLILLDVMLPRMNGFDVCRTLREGGCAIPIIMLTAREEESDKVFGLEAGADDYITKPFSMRELLARVKANIRRRSLDTAQPAQPGSQLLKVGDVAVDPVSMTVTKGGAPVDVTQKEFDLLVFLVSNKGIALSREKILQKVWNYDYYGEDRTVDTHIKMLRGHLGPCRNYIVTVWGIGYKFDPDTL